MTLLHEITFVYEDVDATEAVVTPDLERKSDETEEVLIEEEKDASDVKSGDTEELDLERIQSTARQSTVTPRTLNFEDEAGPSSPIRPTQEEESEEQFKDDEFLADLNRNVLKHSGRSLTLQQSEAFGDRMMRNLLERVQSRMGCRRREKRVGYWIQEFAKAKIPMGSEKEKQMLQERDAKRLLRKRKATVTEEQPSKKIKLRIETIDELRNYLRIVDFEKSAQDRESLEAIFMITEFKVIDSPDGEYLIIYRANTHFRAFDTMWEIDKKWISSKRQKIEPK
ncbi:hypothetical protein Tco_0507669 [Tanacetum coccineum]